MIDSSRRRFGFALFFENRGFNLKHDTKNRASTNLTANFDAATVLPHDVLRNPQAEPGAFLAGGKERIKNACQIVLSDADSGVSKLDQNRRLQCLLVTGSGNNNLAITFDRLLRIDDQIQKYLPQLIGARFNAWQRVVKRLGYSNSQLTHLLFQKYQRLFQQLVNVDPVNLTRPARKPEHLADDVRHALRLFSCNLEKARVLVAFGAGLHQIKRVLDRFERVVHLVRDRRRETPDSSQLLRFKQLLLDASPLKLTNLSQVVK